MAQVACSNRTSYLSLTSHQYFQLCADSDDEIKHKIGDYISKYIHDSGTRDAIRNDIRDQREVRACASLAGNGCSSTDLTSTRNSDPSCGACGGRPGG